MLYEDVTGSAIVVGYLVDVEGDEVSYLQAQQVRDALRSLNEKMGFDLQLFVASDTTDTGSGDAGVMVLGRAAVRSDCFEGPTRFEAATVREAVETFDELSQEYWEKLSEAADLKVGAGSPLQATLISWGPLCYGSVCAGVPLTDDDRGEATYKFIANQDMYQEWSFEGLDGEVVRFHHPDGYDRDMAVEFWDICPVDLSEGAVKSYFEQVSEHDNPSLFLTCRHD